MQLQLIYLTQSALLYSMSYVYPTYFWWSIFIFPTPIVCNIETFKKRPFLYGYAWGLILLSIHLAGINYALLNLAKGPLIQRLIIPIALILFQSIIPGILFLILQRIITSLSLSHTRHILFSYGMIGLWLVYLVHGSCFLTGTVEGYTLMHPLIPLVTQPITRYFLITTNYWICIGMLSIISICISLLWSKKTWYGISLFFLIVVGIHIGNHNIDHMLTQQKPHWLDTITALPAIFYFPYNMTYLLQAVALEIKKLLLKYPKTEIVIMPESSLYCSILQMYNLTEPLSESHIKKPLHILLGSFAWDNNQYRNVFYWIYNGSIKQSYYKRHSMFLTEYIPPLLRNTFIDKLFFNQAPAIEASSNQRPRFTINNSITATPYICSELFFNSNPDDTFENTTIIGIANDRHFLPYINDLMVLHLQKIAIVWKRPIIYVSFTKQIYIDTHGNIEPLQS